MLSVSYTHLVEEGECVLVAKAEGGANRYDKIVAMIEESETLKSGTENRALLLADRLVPLSLIHILFDTKTLALFLGGVVFGSAGFKVLSSKDAKKVYRCV